MRSIRIVVLLVLTLVGVLWGAVGWLLREELSRPVDTGSAPVAGAQPVGQPSRGPGSGAPANPPDQSPSPQRQTQGLVLFPPLQAPTGSSVAIDPFAENGPSPVIVSPAPATSQLRPEENEARDHPSPDSR